MAGNPTVTLEFAGDEKKLTDSMERVGSASKSMSSDVGNASKSMKDSGKSVDDLADSAGGAEQKFIGFKDTITGTGDVLTGFREGNVLTMAQGFADIAGGLESFLIPMLGRLGTAFMATAVGQGLLTAAQWAWNAAATVGTGIMTALNFLFVSTPIGWIILAIGALVAAFVILWNKSAAFRDFFIGVWNGIKSVVGTVVDWIKGVWNGIPGFFRGIGDTIGRIFSGIGNTIKNAFKSAINFVVDILNGGITGINFLIKGYNAIPFAPDIPLIPKIPKMHTGGVVPGIPGEEVLTMLQAGERVSTSSQGGGNVSVTFNGDVDSAFATQFMKLVRTGVITIA